MPIPFAAIGAGASLLGGIFGHRSRPQYRPREFSYTPNELDPELQLRRRRALEEMLRDNASTQNEIGRAGLLGSSASFGILGEQQSRGARTLEDINADVFGKRRQEALGLFSDEENFRRQLALGEQSQQGREHLLGLESLGDIGGFAGGSFDEFLRKRRMRGDYGQGDTPGRGGYL